LLDDVKTALQFLTRLPVRASASHGMTGLASTAWAFPLAGLLVGAFGSLAYALADAAGLPPLPAAILAVAGTIAITGALHEDGLADLFDALGGHAPRARALEIMRDSRIGTYGTLALLVTFALRVTSLASLEAPGRVATALVAAACLSRAAMALLMALQHPARSDGLGAASGRVAPARAGLACVLGLLPLLAVATASPAAALAALLAATLAFAGTERWTRSRLGGFTGDTVGGTQQLCETACLLALAAAWPA
jgi:adenosylcobinamide-GDP ribazoletransferase